MPSTHSAAVSFFVTYIVLASLYLPFHPSIRKPESELDAAVPLSVRLIPPLLAIPIASTMALSRVWLGVHTAAQVAVGWAIGIPCAWAWYQLWTVGGWSVTGQKVEQWFHETIF